uniref:Uncharacterized protein n=1 Tax=Amphimedon queenslandica TaxID=400682 RepID=A0A1X7UYE8_AMPQE
MPAFRPVLRSLGLYQDPEASIYAAQGAGSETSGMYRRCTRLSRDGEGKRPHGGFVIFAGEPGEDDHSNPGDRVTGNDSGLSNYGAKTTLSEDKEIDARICNDKESSRHTHRAGCITPPGQAKCSLQGSYSRSSLLQSFAERPDNIIRGKRAKLVCSLPPVTSSHRGIRVVAGTALNLEWQESHLEGTRHPDRFECFPQALASSNSGVSNRSLVKGGKDPSYKRSQVASSNPSSKNFPEESGKQTNTTAVGQPDCSSICEQHGWDSIHPGNKVSQRIVDVVSREGHPPDCSTTGRKKECHSRLRVESTERSLRLDVECCSVSMNFESIPQPPSGSVCNQIDSSTASFLQMKARSSS